MKRSILWLLFMPILFVASFSDVRNARANGEIQTNPITSPQPLTAVNVAKFVDAFVAENMAAAHAPGLVITIVYQGEVALSQGYGVADIEHNRPMTPQTNLRAGSVSKPVTSTGVLQLVADEQIALDVPVSNYLPNLPLEDDAYGVAGTVAQFLTLQGGYSDVVLQTHSPTLEEWQPLGVYLQNNLPPRVLSPGKVLIYNSWEHALLGQVMVEVTEQPFDQVMNNTLFQPLGMTQTTFTQPLPESIADNLATGYSYADGEYNEVPLDYVNLSPGIALVTTGEDMGRFMLALLNEGMLDGEQLLAPGTVAGMLNRQEMVHPLSRSRTYGLSEVTLAGRQVLYQDGNGIGFGNRMILSPEHDLGIFLSVNHRALTQDIISNTPAYAFMKDLSVALLEQYLPVSEQESPVLSPLHEAAERAPRYIGHYRLAGIPQEDFFKLGELMDYVDVSDNGDGTIMIGSRRYMEVEPLVFQSETNPSFFVVFVEDDNSEVQWLTFGGTGSYQKTSWRETPTVQFAAMGIMLLGFLAFVILMPFSRHRYWPAWGMSLLSLAFLVALAHMMTQTDLIIFYKTIPFETKLVFLLPALIGVLAVTYPLAIASLYRNQAAVRVWLLYVLNGSAMVVFIWFVRYWNLYQV